MKTMLLAGLVLAGFGVNAANAESEGGVVPNTYFTELPGVVSAPPVQVVPARPAGAQNAGPLATFVTSHSNTIWQAPPSEGANN